VIDHWEAGWYYWPDVRRLHWVAAGQREIAACGRVLPSRRVMSLTLINPQPSDCCAACKRALVKSEATP
jgi:hypothetical protein